MELVRRGYKNTSTLRITYSVSVKSYKHGEGTTIVNFFLAVTVLIYSLHLLKIYCIIIIIIIIIITGCCSCCLGIED